MPAREKEATRSVIYFSRASTSKQPAKQAEKHDSAGLPSMESAGEKKLTRKGSNDDIY